jgi:trk system potassium uptake protein TrkH
VVDPYLQKHHHSIKGTDYRVKATKIKEEEKIFDEAVYVIVLFIAVSVITGIIISYIDKENFLDSLVESVSGLTTMGLSSGITSLETHSMTLLVSNTINYLLLTLDV